MKLLTVILFTLAGLLCHAQTNYVSGVNATYTFGPADCISYAQPFNGCKTDSSFAVTKYTLFCVEAFGNAGEYCKVRLTANGVNYGSFKVYAGQPKNIPNNSIVNPYAVITAGTLTTWINNNGDTLAPSVECTAFR